MEEGEVMTSDKQADANRRNALKSTGPKTPEGKAVTRLNAVKHGLLSKDVLLPGDDESALKELGDRLRNELQPSGELEDQLVEQVIAGFWRLRRLRRVETGIFIWQLYGELRERAQGEGQSYERNSLDDLIEGQYTTVTNEQQHKEALSKVEELKKVQQEAETATLGWTFMRDASEANAFSKLSRYEAAIARSIYRALHELQRLQAARQVEGSVTPPAVLDVDVSGVSREDV
jgi:hypothetical protein